MTLTIFVVVGVIAACKLIAWMWSQMPASSHEVKAALDAIEIPEDVRRTYHATIRTKADLQAAIVRLRHESNVVRQSELQNAFNQWHCKRHDYKSRNAQLVATCVAQLCVNGKFVHPAWERFAANGIVDKKLLLSIIDQLVSRHSTFEHGHRYRLSAGTASIHVTEEVRFVDWNYSSSAELWSADYGQEFLKEVALCFVNGGAAIKRIEGIYIESNSLDWATLAANMNRRA